MGDALAEMARELGVGISHLITTGNEAMVSTTDALHYLIEDDATRAIAMFTESVKDPELFVQTAQRARELGKAIVALKAGTSVLAARNALSHTGSLVGDDRVIDTAFRQYGVIRAHSLEEVLTTAATIAHTGPLSAPGVAVVSISGGSCDIVADDAERVGLALPQLSEAAQAKIRAMLPAFASVQNPLDITGGAAGDDTFERVLEVVDHEDEFGAVAALCNVPVFESAVTPTVANMLGAIGRGLRSSRKPGVLLSQTFAHLNSVGKAAVERGGVPLCLPGLALGTQALGHLSSWSRWLERSPRLHGAPTPLAVPSDQATGSLSEWQARALLEHAGVPFVPAELVSSADEAVKAAASFGTPVAIKLVSPDVLHKSDFGAVRLGVEGEEAVREGYDAVVAAGLDAGPDVRIEGVLVAPMRSGGQELLVGVTVDRNWGAMLVVGLGGVFVEVLRDTAMRLLPVGTEDVEEMLDELAGAPLLHGARGTPPVAMAPLVDAILAVAEAGLGLGDRLDSLEINPLLAAADTVEALDALVVLNG